MHDNDKGKVSAVQYASRSLTSSEGMYKTFKKETAAVIFALKNTQHHFLGGPFVVYSGHKAFRAAFEDADIHGRLTIWLNIMAEYAFEICYVKGKQNVLSDFLPRSFGEVVV